jgi:hypothetical protein
MEFVPDVLKQGLGSGGVEFHAGSFMLIAIEKSGNKRDI